MKRYLGLAFASMLSISGVSGAMAADLPMKALPMAEPAFTWTGGYLGINGGWAQDNTDTTLPAFVQPSTKNGWLGGGHGGFNYQFGSWVLGAELDADYMRLNASAPCNNVAFTCNTSLQNQMSFRARGGVAFDRFLFYVTGGLAMANYNGNTTVNSTGIEFPSNSSRIGWIAGVGAEYAVTRNIIVGLEYLHADYGQATMNYDVPYPSVRVTDDVVRARLSYKFDMVAPVVAKY